MDDLFDDLRGVDSDSGSDGEFTIDFDSDDIPVELGQVIGETSRSGTTGPFLGMSAGERAFLSMMIFFNVLVLGIGLLIATGRLVF